MTKESVVEWVWVRHCHTKFPRSDNVFPSLVSLTLSAPFILAVRSFVLRLHFVFHIFAVWVRVFCFDFSYASPWMRSHRFFSILRLCICPLFLLCSSEPLAPHAWMPRLSKFFFYLYILLYEQIIRFYHFRIFRLRCTRTRGRWRWNEGRNRR